MWWVQDQEYLGRITIRHHLTPPLQGPGGSTRGRQEAIGAGHIGPRRPRACWPTRRYGRCRWSWRRPATVPPGTPGTSPPCGIWRRPPGMLAPRPV